MQIQGINPPYRAEHVGSLLRPQELRAAFREAGSGPISSDEFRAIQDASVRQAIKLQEAIGLHCVTDGEFRRTSYWSHLVAAVAGLGVEPSRFKFRNDDGNETEFLAPHVESSISRLKSYSSDEAEFLLSAASRPAKVTMPSPSTMHFWDTKEFLRNGV